MIPSSTRARAYALGSAVLVSLGLLACTSDPIAGAGGGVDEGVGRGVGGEGGGDAVVVTVGVGPSAGAGPGGGADACAEEAKVVYLVSLEDDLWSFDPRLEGLDAYRRVGRLGCPSTSSPQSMSVDRSGTAWVFYSDGKLFRVSTRDASCQATSYAHPNLQSFNQLGMGFTAVAAGHYQEKLYVISPSFGLATIDTQTFAVDPLGGLVGAAELTGGGDAKLFVFAAQQAVLGEVHVDAMQATELHRFTGLEGTMAWAFSRYAGTFYMFTSPDPAVGSRCTAYDPILGQATTRDANLGFTVVGAGQSICVPSPDTPN